jgi:hypothetical protein
MQEPAQAQSDGLFTTPTIERARGLRLRGLIIGFALLPFSDLLGSRDCAERDFLAHDSARGDADGRGAAERDRAAGVPSLAVGDA